MKRWYDVNGLVLTIDAEPPELSQAIDQHVAPFAAPASSTHDYAITITRGEAHAPPDGTETISEGDVLPGIPSRFATHGGLSWLAVPGQLSIISDQQARATAIRIGEPCDRRLQTLAAVHAIDVALEASGQHLVHGAALALPHADQAFLLFGPSGTGKTTTALALALGGFGLMTDDAIVLQPGDAGQPALVWGLPRALKVHRHTAELLPRIAPLLCSGWNEEGEQPLTLADLQSCVRTVAPRPIAVAAVVVLGERRPARDHEFAPLDKGSALLHLAQDNIKRAPDGVSPTQAKRFAALSRLLAATPAFKVHVGTNLDGLPHHLATALQQHLRREIDSPP